jgi:hypothetical protein
MEVTTLVFFSTRQDGSKPPNPDAATMVMDTKENVLEPAIVKLKCGLG